MTNLPTWPGEIAAVRIRLSWRGQPITQVGRREMRARNHEEVHEEPTGRILWDDAYKADAIELAAFLKSRCE